MDMRVMTIAILLGGPALLLPTQFVDLSKRWDFRMDVAAVYPGTQVKEGTLVTVRCGWSYEPGVNNDGYVTVSSPLAYSVSVWRIPPSGGTETLLSVERQIEPGQYTRDNYTGEKFLSAKSHKAELTANWTAKSAGSHMLGCQVKAGPQITEISLQPHIATNLDNNKKTVGLQVIGTLTPGTWPAQPQPGARPMAHAMPLTVVSPTPQMVASGSVYVHVRVAKSLAQAVNANGVAFEWQRLTGQLWLPQSLLNNASWTGDVNGILEVLRPVSGLSPGSWRMRARMGAGSPTDWVLFTAK